MEKKTQIITALILAGGTVLAAAITIGPNFLRDSEASAGVATDKGGATDIHFPVALSAYYKPTGWMGDGENGSEFVSVENVAAEIEGKAVPALKIVYRPGGPLGWAGIYWQYPENNWGTAPGRNLQGAKSVSFYARGETGNEICEFKSGGIHDENLSYHDSLETSLGDLVLARDWKRYEIPLTGKDLSNVLGAFAWISGAPSTEPRTIYLANLQIN